MQQAKHRQLYADEMRQMLSDGVWVKDEALLKRVREEVNHPNSVAVVYKQTDSEMTILEYPHGHFFLQSLENLNQYIDSLKTQHRSALPLTHTLDGLIPYGADFPDHVVELAESLAGLFEVPPESLDFTYESLKVVDEALLRLRYGRKCSEPPIFAALVAYWGEVMRRRTNGRWIMRQVKEYPHVWNPILRTEKGEAVEVAMMFYKVLDDGEGFSLYEE